MGHPFANRGIPVNSNLEESQLLLFTASAAILQQNSPSDCNHCLDRHAVGILSPHWINHKKGGF
jgi:hypothetical protein